MNGYEIASMIIASGISMFLLLKGFAGIIKAVESATKEEK